MKLSFCIPTFNRKDMLRQTINSVLSQRADGVEIVICDNCSSDGTYCYIQNLKEKFGNITYFRWENEVPCGENLLKSVDLASGEFCWLLTDDDVLEKDAIEKVMLVLKNFPDLIGISVNATGYDKALKNKKQIRYAHNLQQSRHFTSFNECYFELGAWFGYWSSQIIKKENWNLAKKDLRYLQYHGYHHLFLILKMIQETPNWYYMNQKLAGYRADNESFVQEFGIYTRYKLDLFTYRDIGRYFLGERALETRNVCRLVLNNYSFWQIISMKYQKTSSGLFFRVGCISFKYYKSYTEFWYKILPALLLPRCVLLGMRVFYRRFLKNDSDTDNSYTNI